MTASPVTTRAPRRLSRRVERMNPSAVREILKVAGRAEIISFAGGLPAPELFPVDAIAAAHEQVLRKEGRSTLQYGVTEGHLPLRQWIVERMRSRGVETSPDQILITSGAQQALDLAARVLLDPGDVVAVENPTYLAAIQLFGGYESHLVPIDSDDGGMRIEALEQALKSQPIRVIYLVTDFQNPRGTSVAPERRDALVRLAEQYGAVVIEDDPYGELRFSGEASAPLAARSSEVVYLGTFSKTLAPGMRLGWMHGPPDLVRAATIAKQSADLHTAMVGQRAAATLFETFDYDGHLQTLRKVYGERCLAMQQALEQHLPSGARWTSPEGGLFLWLELPEGTTDMQLFDRAIESGVAVVPGSAFFCGKPEHRFVRLNFSNQSLERIEEGIARLGQALR